MSVIGADGLSLLVGNGQETESFTALKGATVTRLEIDQKNNTSTAMDTDAWGISVGLTERNAIVECTALATDDASAVRVRDLVLNGLVGNFQLEVGAGETLSFSAVVTQYREVIGAGAVKTLFLRLESSGAVAIG